MDNNYGNMNDTNNTNNTNSTNNNTNNVNFIGSSDNSRKEQNKRKAQQIKTCYEKRKRALNRAYIALGKVMYDL